jgi:hypothetical protein
MLLDIELPKITPLLSEEIKEYFKNYKVLIYTKGSCYNILLETTENINTIRNRINNKYSVTCKCYVAKNHEKKIIIDSGSSSTMLYNNLYTNGEMFEKYIFVGIGGLISMENIGLYKCNYPNDQDVCNIITSSDDIPLSFSGMSKNTAKYIVPRNGDITKYIEVDTVNGTEEVFEVVIEIGETIVHAQIYNTSNIKIKPFVYGFPNIALMYEHVVVYITGNNRNIKVSSNQLYLSRGHRSNLCNRELIFDDSNRIYDGRFYKNNNVSPVPVFNHTVESNVKNIEEVQTTKSSEYLCNYPSDPDIDNIKCDQKTIKEYGSCSPQGIHKYEIDMQKNIISRFTIYGKAKSFRLEIGGQHMMTKTLESSDMIHTFKPFSFGIPYTKYHMAKIEIESDPDERITLESVRLVLNEEDIAKIFPPGTPSDMWNCGLKHDFIDSSTGKEYKFSNGMMSKKYLD